MRVESLLRSLVIVKDGQVTSKNLVLDLILALANEAAARILPSRIADRTLSRDLGILYSRVDANLVNIVSFIPLVELIVRNLVHQLQ